MEQFSPRSQHYGLMIQKGYSPILLIEISFLQWNDWQ